jgi:hypothetical protein
MNPSVRDLEQALSIRREINALEKRLAAILGGPAARSKARRTPPKTRLTARRKAAPARSRRQYEYDHHYGIRLAGK